MENCTTKKNITYISCDLEKNSLNIAEKVDYIVHCAAVTASKDMIKYPVDCLKLAANSTLNLLELARTKSVINMVFISSMEVYGILNTQDHKITENQLGYVNLASVRSCYPEGKRYCECLCNAYAAQYNVNVVTARLAQTFGAGILKNRKQSVCTICKKHFIWRRCCFAYKRSFRRELCIFGGCYNRNNDIATQRC